MTITNNLELFAAVRILSNDLEQMGRHDWASRLTDALTISTVTGEIFGETRLQLQRLLASETPLNPASQSLANDALNAINLAFKPQR